MYAKVLMEALKLFLNRWNCAGFFFSVYLYYLIFRNAHVFFITKKVILIIKTHTETRLGIIFAAKKKHIEDSKGRKSTYKHMKWKIAAKTNILLVNKDTEKRSALLE